MRRSIISTLAVLVLGASASQAQNLLTNGNFSAGNTGFTTGYNISGVFPPGPDGPGHYNIVTQTIQFNPAYGQTFGDHTSGTGNMLIVNGSPISNLSFWGNNVAVAQNSTYTFSGWFASALVTPDPSPASIVLSINGTALNPAGFAVNATAGGWTQYTTTWNSGANTVANLSMSDRNLGDFGNDFVVDDLVFQGPAANAPEPGTLALLGLAALPVAGLLRRRNK